MAAPICTAASLMSLTGCFQGTREANRRKRIYAKAVQLKAIGGGDYTTGLSTTLVTAVACLIPLYPDQRDSIRTAIEYNKASNAGATISSNPSTVAISTKCLKGVPNNTLEVMEIFLDCQLGYGHAYPQ
jgi:hypothetical protein